MGNQNKKLTAQKKKDEKKSSLRTEIARI